MIVAQNFAEQPAAIVKQPDMGEFLCAAAIAVGFTGFADIKFMDAGLDHAVENSIAKKWKYFETVSHSFADGLLFRVSADIVFLLQRETLVLCCIPPWSCGKRPVPDEWFLSR